MIDGNEIWEALFSIFEGFVPEGMTEDACQRLAEALNTRSHEGALLEALEKARPCIRELLTPLERACLDLVSRGKVPDQNAEAAFDRAHACLATIDAAIQLARGEVK